VPPKNLRRLILLEKNSDILYSPLPHYKIDPYTKNNSIGYHAIYSIK
jgi:hypothetical protein